MGEDRETRVVRNRDFALNERRGVAGELEVHAHSILINPLAGEFFHAVGDVGERREARLANVVVAVAADECDHFVGLAVDGGLDGGLPGEEALIGVGFRDGVGGGALGDAGLAGAGFDTGEVLLDEIFEIIASTTKLGVTKGIGGLGSRNVVAVGINQALANDDEAVFLALEDALHVGNEFFRRERDFG